MDAMHWKRTLAYDTGYAPSTGEQMEELVLRFAQKNRSWGYRRIVEALRNLGHNVSHQTVANFLIRHDVAPAPERERTLSWREFIPSHLKVLPTVDYFTAAVWTARGLTTYYGLTWMRVATRNICVVGITTWPNLRWTAPMARNVSFAEVGFLNGCRYLLHDRASKFCEAFTGILDAVGIQSVKLPPRSPNRRVKLGLNGLSFARFCV